MLGIGFIWPKSFTTSAVLYAAETNIIEPLLKGRAEITEIDRAQSAKEIIYTRQFLEAVAKEAGLVGADPKAEKIDSALKFLRRTIQIIPVGKEYFKVSYSSGSANESYKTLVSVVQAFINYTVKQKKDESYSAYKFIDSQVQAYKKQLEEADEKLKEFKSKNTEGSELSVSQRIAQLRSEIEELTLERDETASRMATLKKQVANESNYLQAKFKLEELEDRKRSLLASREDLRITYQENYPDVVSINFQLEEIDKKIEAIYGAEGVAKSVKSDEATNPLFEELRIQLSGAEVNYRAQSQRIESLKKLREQGLERAEKVASNEAQLSDLTRDYDVTKSVYEEMLERKENARLSMVLDIEGQGVSYQIHEPAVYPLGTTGLRFIHFALAGPFIGLIIPIALLIAYIIVDPRLRSSRSVASAFGDYMLVSVPHHHTALGARIFKRDVLVILFVGLVFTSLYVLVIANRYFTLF